jgi:hypothetical protein
MVIHQGEYVHIIHRQLFQNDAQRHFVGTVGGARREPHPRERLSVCHGFNSQLVCPPRTAAHAGVALGDSVIVNVLPSHVKIDEITYTHRPNGDVHVTDGTDWHLDITHL